MDKSDTSVVSKRVRRWLIISLVMAVLGALLMVYFPPFINDVLQSQLQIREEGNDFTRAWQVTPFPIRFDAYVFTIDNPREFAEGAKPRIKEMGPYAYDYLMYKNIESFSPDQRKVRFTDSQSFHFRPDLTPGSLSDKVTVVNFPVYAMANLVRTLVSALPGSFAITPIAMAFANLLFRTHRERFLKETTVGELLNGYPFGILDTIDTLTRPLTWLGVTLPDTGMPDNKFGFLWTKNFTTGGPYEAYTGHDNTPLLRITSFKDNQELSFYPEARCNIINGTEGSTLGVNVRKDAKYYLFTADLCKTFDVVYEQDSWVNAIPTYRFIPNPTLFSAPRKNAANRCYCLTPENEDMCDGVFDLSRCLGGAPVLYSFPHFLHASRAIRNGVDGVHPDPEKHQAFLDVEPWTGAPIRAAEKIQMNAMIRPIPYLSGFRKLPEVILPLIWFEKSVVIDDKFTMQIRMGVWPLYAITFIIYFLCFGGLALFGLLVAHVVRKRVSMQAVNSIPRSESREPLQASFNAAPAGQNGSQVYSVQQTNEPVYWRGQRRPEAQMDATMRRASQQARPRASANMRTPINGQPPFQTSRNISHDPRNVQSPSHDRGNIAQSQWTSIDQVVLNPTNNQGSIVASQIKPRTQDPGERSNWSPPGAIE